MSAPCERPLELCLLELLPSDFQQKAWYDSSIPGRDGDGAMIYLDNNATTFLIPAVRDQYRIADRRSDSATRRAPTGSVMRLARCSRRRAIR